ncbi:MAG: transposase, partial [Gammaproteobacteria bacterium]|nr:transposase [Gammaproteobacteria bacterium]
SRPDPRRRSGSGNSRRRSQSLPIGRKSHKTSNFLYRYRHKVECFFSKIKYFRAIATRYEKRAENYLALVKLAAIRIWLRSYESVS